MLRIGSQMVSRVLGKVADGCSCLTLAVMVHGIDLFPPRQPWVPPNCILEVDDATKPWLRTDKFDLVHMRFMTGSFTDDQWREVYRNAYKNLKPGGWLEHVEFGVIFHCDDDSIAPDSVLGKCNGSQLSHSSFLANIVARGPNVHRGLR